jgi:hypothetical protein
MNFMMAYECFVMWAFKYGLERVLKPKEIQSAMIAIQQHFEKHAWSSPGALAAIWERADFYFQIGLTGPMGFPSTAEMSVAAKAAGYPFDPINLTALTIEYTMGFKFKELVEKAPAMAQIAAKAK